MNTHKSIPIKDAINRCLDYIEKGGSDMSDILSGYPSLDKLTRGWGPGELIVMAARPCVGTTTLGLNFARNAAVDFKIPTVYFSLDLGTIDLTIRLIASESGLHFYTLRDPGNMSDEDWIRMESSIRPLTQAPLFIDDSVGSTVEKIMERMEEYIANDSAKFFILDSFQMFFSHREKSLPGPSVPDREKSLWLLKDFALKKGVTIMITAYLRRPMQKKFYRPTPADLDTYCPGAEEYADKIILPYRPYLLDFLDTRHERYEPMELMLVKNKNGETGSRAVLKFDKHTLKISESTENDDLYG